MIAFTRLKPKLQVVVPLGAQQIATCRCVRHLYLIVLAADFYLLGIVRMRDIRVQIQCGWHSRYLQRINDYKEQQTRLDTAALTYASASGFQILIKLFDQ